MREMAGSRKLWLTGIVLVIGLQYLSHETGKQWKNNMWFQQATINRKLPLYVSRDQLRVTIVAIEVYKTH